jgi:DNA-binding CsgD family transcriptional regulator
MARLLFIPNDTTFIVLDSPLSASHLIKAIQDGTWCPPEPYLPGPDCEKPFFSAVRFGSFVIAAPRQPVQKETDHPKLKLTRRTQDVLQLLAEGLTDKEIAASLGLSKYTVSNHINTLKIRLGARTRAQSISRAVTLGLVKMKKREE